MVESRRLTSTRWKFGVLILSCITSRPVKNHSLRPGSSQSSGAGEKTPLSNLPNDSSCLFAGIFLVKGAFWLLLWGTNRVDLRSEEIRVELVSQGHLIVVVKYLVFSIIFNWHPHTISFHSKHSHTFIEPIITTLWRSHFWLNYIVARFERKRAEIVKNKAFDQNPPLILKSGSCRWPQPARLSVPGWGSSKIPLLSDIR